jgi:diguanylate cyclase (GGDEF)-like protein/PAS domain S-box-containing protein
MTGFSDPLADHGSWEHDLATRETLWSDAVYRLHGVSPEDFAPRAGEMKKLVHPDDYPRYRESFYEAAATGAPFTVQHRVVWPDGSVRTLVARGAHMPDANGGPGRMLGTTQDVTGRIGTDERLWHLANNDALTGLFNRRRFLEELKRELAVARRSGTRGAVLMLDLDHFKDINDSLGHMAGDALLPRIAEALRARLRVTDTLARIGGDEFAIVLPACSQENATSIAADLLEALNAAVVHISGRDRRVTASIGVAPFGFRDQHSADSILVEADLAMYRAKGQGPGRFEVFDEEMRANLAARVAIEAQLRASVETGDFELHYQPITSVADGTVVACEALIRWRHPVRGIVGPTEFIPIAEEYGLISSIGEWVLEEACRVAALWRSSGRSLAISVNVSPQQLIEGDFVSLVQSTLERLGLPAQLLCLEITETALFRDASPLVRSLEALRALGVRIAMDDFGGGSSSLGLLRMLPLDVIKIDRMFVSGIEARSEDRAIVAAVLSLADELGLGVIAEGVETEQQHWKLKELGCNFCQGYLYGKPMPAEDLVLDGYSGAVQPGVADPVMIREFMRQIGIPARVGT